MREHKLPSRHLWRNLRALLVVLWIALIGCVVAAVLVEGHILDSQPAAQQLPHASTTATAAPPTGRRWFFDRSLWEQPFAPQP